MNLPLHHPLCQSATPAQVWEDFYRFLVERRTELRTLAATATGKTQQQLRRQALEQLAAIDEMLASDETKPLTPTGDPVFDAWEAAVARGEEADFDEQAVLESLER